MSELRLASPRFRRAAQLVVDDAKDRGGGTWAVAQDVGGRMLVVAAAGDPQVASEGQVVGAGEETAVAVPLVLPDGTRFGALLGFGAAEGPAVATAQLERLAEVLTTVLAVEWEAQTHARRAEAEARRAGRAEDEALTDPLTGVANRRAWDRAVETEERRLRRYGGQAAIIVVDVDDLRHVNATQGHLGGDLLLRMVAGTLAVSSRESDTVARTGGDEFAVLALDCDEEHLEVLLDRFRKALAEQGAAASVGGICWRPPTPVAEIYARADRVMYDEKSRRKR
jgi:diguanylate cyclase